MTALNNNPQTIPGVQIINLKMNKDIRGAVTEIYRKQWAGERTAVQLNYSFAKAGTLRGLHTHLRQWDYIVNVQGKMRFALVDFRKDSPAFLKSVMFNLSSSKMQGVIIPPSVGHGFYFAKSGAYILLTDNYYDGTDQIRCRFDAPELKLIWPTKKPTLSSKDRLCGGVKETLQTIAAGQA